MTSYIFRTDPEHQQPVQLVEAPEASTIFEVAKAHDQLLAGDVAAYVMPYDGQSDPRELHSRREELLEQLSGLRGYRSIQINTDVIKPGDFHYDRPDNPKSAVFLHTTLEGGGQAWFSRIGHEFMRITRLIDICNPYAQDPFIESSPSKEKLVRIADQLLAADKVDVRLCSPVVYTAYLKPGDSVVMEVSSDSNVWHRFDTETEHRKAISVPMEYARD